MLLNDYIVLLVLNPVTGEDKFICYEGFSTEEEAESYVDQLFKKGEVKGFKDFCVWVFTRELLNQVLKKEVI